MTLIFCQFQNCYSQELGTTLKYIKSKISSIQYSNGDNTYKYTASYPNPDDKCLINIRLISENVRSGGSLPETITFTIGDLDPKDAKLSYEKSFKAYKLIFFTRKDRKVVKSDVYRKNASIFVLRCNDEEILKRLKKAFLVAINNF